MIGRSDFAAVPTLLFDFDFTFDDCQVGVAPLDGWTAFFVETNLIALSAIDSFGRIDKRLRAF